jgi:hypothetical protein
MQMNEFAGQGQHGPRRPQVKQAPTVTRETPETRAEELGADESRLPAARRATRKPRHFGAGF